MAYRGLPSAPEYDAVETETSQQLYPVLPQPENFWLTKITEIEKDIGNEVEHYRKASKKYKFQRVGTAVEVKCPVYAQPPHFSFPRA